ncbi:MAG: ABC transporter substrate-binding protein [Neisseriaceae bacterium]|nr:ABC transporter substrate-binding protein [Neisseriaceae bacterium]
MKKYLFTVLTFFAGLVYADTPVQFIQNNAKQGTEILNSNKSAEQIRTEIERLVLPKFDFTRMTALAVGKPWQNATPAQKTALSTEFQTLLVRTYSSGMLRYKGSTVNVNQEANISNNNKEASVKSTIIFKDGKTATADYNLYQSGNSWKIYNIYLEGASLVTIYRNQFAEEIRKGGIDGLISALKEKNSK